jgi:hypothetical protein
MGRGGQLLVEHVLKTHPSPFKTGGVDIGNVIPYHIHSGLMILKSRYAGKQ